MSISYQRVTTERALTLANDPGAIARSARLRFGETAKFANKVENYPSRCD